MEDTKCHRRQAIAMLREFSGGRLEKQVLSRAYELAAPVIRVSTLELSMSDAAGRSITCEQGSQVTAKGA
jgi:hypothetical protein